ncbi:MAG: RDD family protein [Bdellovibrionota bacterium]
MVVRDQTTENDLSLVRTEELDARLASPLHRFAAFVIDYYIIVWPIILLAVSPLVRSMKLSMMVGDDYESNVALITTWIVGWFLILFYQAVCLSFWGATPGMKIMKLEIVNLWNHNTRPTLVGAFSRAFFLSMGFIFFGIPFLGIFAYPRRRAFHDRALNTVVLTTRSRYAVKAPGLTEMLVTRTVTWMFVGSLLIGFISTLLYEAKKGDLKNKVSLSERLGREDAACAGLNEAYENWPQENGEIASRLSVAMALFAAEQIERECLEKEARNPFLDEKDVALSYLAKSFIHADNQELSDLYLEQVCHDADSKSEDCVLAEVIEAMSNEDYAVIDQKFSELSPHGRVYSKVWALRQYLREERYEEASDYLDGLPDDLTLGHFSVPSRVKVLWGLKKPEAARQAARTAYDTLPAKDKTDLSGWMCFEEMSQSCEQTTQKSCQIFGRATEQDDRMGRDLLPALTMFKMAECSENKTEGYQKLLQGLLHSEVKNLVQATAENDYAGLRKMLLRSKPYEEIENEVADEAALVLAETTKDDTDMSLIQEVWSEKSYGLRWEQIGLKLFSFWQSKKDWLQAVKVGEKLAPSLREDEFLQEYAVTLYKAGMKKEAVELVADIESMTLKSETERQPASQDDYEELLKLIEEKEK